MPVNTEIKLFKNPDVLFWFLTIVLCSWLFFRGDGGEATTAVLQIGDVDRYQLSLTAYGPVRTKNRHLPVEIAITKEGIQIVSSNCPRQICVNQKAINKPGKMIICVPYKILIYIPDTKRHEESKPVIITG